MHRVLWLECFVDLYQSSATVAFALTDGDGDPEWLGLPEKAKAETLILVVDDDPDLLQSLRVLLEAYDYRVILAGDAEAAVTAVAEQKPDLVLTDIYMPDADGFELINALRQRNLMVPVIAMSGGGRIGNYDNLSIATHLGAAAVIDKPFSNASLIDTIERVVTGRQAEH
jgi:two-component system chemotaxis response regulator CheY